MLGPVYALEWIQATRRAQKTPWRIIYAMLLFVETQWLTMNLLEYLFWERSPRLLYVAEALLYIIAAQQALVILAVTPAFAAGSITDERRRGTFDFLLATPLSSIEIILGKWLGQATRVLYLVSPGYVLLVLLTGTVGETDVPGFLPMLEQIALIYALTAIGLLMSVWSRSTPKAVLMTFAVLGVVAFGEWLLQRPALASSVWAAPLGIRVTTAQRLLGIAGLALVTTGSLGMAPGACGPLMKNSRFLGRESLDAGGIVLLSAIRRCAGRNASSATGCPCPSGARRRGGSNTRCLPASSPRWFGSCLFPQRASSLVACK